MLVCQILLFCRQLPLIIAAERLPLYTPFYEYEMRSCRCFRRALHMRHFDAAMLRRYAAVSPPLPLSPVYALSAIACALLCLRSPFRLLRHAAIF